MPQYLLEDAVLSGRGAACSVVCAQPRRIAATSVAERVVAERGEPAPGAAGSAVGCGCAHVSIRLRVMPFALIIPHQKLQQFRYDAACLAQKSGTALHLDLHAHRMRA